MSYYDYLVNHTSSALTESENLQQEKEVDSFDFNQPADNLRGARDKIEASINPDEPQLPQENQNQVDQDESSVELEDLKLPEKVLTGAQHDESSVNFNVKERKSDNDKAQDHLLM